MDTNQNTNQTQENNITEGFHSQVQAYLSKDKQYLILRLPGGMRVIKHVNFVKKILGISFIPKSAQEDAVA